MKTVDLRRAGDEVSVRLELSEFELTTLVALVEQGQQRLGGEPRQAGLHEAMNRTANEFRSLLGHLELLSPHD